MSRVDRLPRLSAAARDRLRDVAARRAPGGVVEGRKAVLDALARPGVRVREVWLREDASDDDAERVCDAAAARDVPVGVVDARDAARLADTVTPQGVLALVDDVARPLASLLAADGVLLLLDRVQDPGNVGAILRVAAAFGVAGVVVTDGTADPLGQKALRASAGTALVVPFARAATAEALAGLRDAARPLWLLDGAGDDLFAPRAVPSRLALAVGSEGAGPSEAVRAAAAASVGIPVAPAVDSLNVAVATGIAVAHLVRASRTGAP